MEDNIILWLLLLPHQPVENSEILQFNYKIKKAVIECSCVKLKYIYYHIVRFHIAINCMYSNVLHVLHELFFPLIENKAIKKSESTLSFLDPYQIIILKVNSIRNEGPIR